MVKTKKKTVKAYGRTIIIYATPIGRPGTTEAQVKKLDITDINLTRNFLKPSKKEYLTY